MKQALIFSSLFLSAELFFAQSVSKTMLRLPDTGETIGYTATAGEDNDFSFNAPFFTINGDGSVTDTITGLMWQQTDGGEMTVENAAIYCNGLSLAGHTDWRLPTAHEAFSILNHQYNNPALDITVFTSTVAEYWWTSDRQLGDTTKIWATNSGGGIGNHPKAETISAGGVKHFHARAVRDVNSPSIIATHFTDNGNGTITDQLTNLIWQKIPYTDTLTWEQSLVYADTLSLIGASDWRLPNIKELQSINDESISNPSIATLFFPTIGINNYWSSTTLPNQTTKSWYLNTKFGITTYDVKTAKHYLLCVRGNASSITGIYESEKKTATEWVYQNPFHSTIQLKSTTGAEQFELLNAAGQLMYSGNNICKQDFAALPTGVYFLKIVNKKTIVIKLIKE
jgi:Protein of unknown function (DUF1566)